MPSRKAKRERLLQEKKKVEKAAQQLKDQLQSKALCRHIRMTILGNEEVFLMFWKVIFHSSQYIYILFLGCFYRLGKALFVVRCLMRNLMEILIEQIVLKYPCLI
jgi:hypothetical protein